MAQTPTHSQPIPRNISIQIAMLTVIAVCMVALVLILGLPYVLSWNNVRQETAKERVLTTEAKEALLKNREVSTYLHYLEQQSDLKHNIKEVPQPKKAALWFDSLSYLGAVNRGLPMRYFRVEVFHPLSQANTQEYKEVTYYVMAKDGMRWEKKDSHAFTVSYRRPR